MKQHDNQLSNLQTHLAEGEAKIARGEGIGGFSMASIIQEQNNEDRSRNNLD